MINTRWLANPNRGCGHFSHYIGPRMNMLSIVKVKILVWTLNDLTARSWSRTKPHILTYRCPDMKKTGQGLSTLRSSLALNFNPTSLSIILALNLIGLFVLFW